MSFLMTYRLIDFALAVVLTLLMFKVCGIIGILKFFDSSGTGRVKNKKEIGLMCGIQYEY